VAFLYFLANWIALLQLFADKREVNIGLLLHDLNSVFVMSFE